MIFLIIIISIISRLLFPHHCFKGRTKEEINKLKNFDKELVRALKTLLKNKILRYYIFDYK